MKKQKKAVTVATVATDAVPETVVQADRPMVNPENQARSNVLKSSNRKQRVRPERPMCNPARALAVLARAAKAEPERQEVDQRKTLRQAQGKHNKWRRYNIAANSFRRVSSW